MRTLLESLFSNLNKEPYIVKRCNSDDSSFCSNLSVRRFTRWVIPKYLRHEEVRQGRQLSLP